MWAAGEASQTRLPGAGRFAEVGQEWLRMEWERKVDTEGERTCSRNSAAKGAQKQSRRADVIKMSTCQHGVFKSPKQGRQSQGYAGTQVKKFSFNSFDCHSKKKKKKRNKIIRSPREEGQEAKNMKTKRTQAVASKSRRENSPGRWG